LQIREFRNDEFVNRVKEIEYLKSRFDPLAFIVQKVQETINFMKKLLRS